MPWLRLNYAPIILFSLVGINYIFADKLGAHMGTGFYLNLFFSAMLVGSLLSQNRLLFISKRLDKKIGDYSYPIYLVHIQAAVLLHSMTGLQEGSIKFATLVLPIVFMISWIMLKAIADPVERLRLKVKEFRI